MQLTQAVISRIQIGLIYALVVVGLTIIWGLMGMINFAHGELMMWGMFAAWSLSFFFKLDPIVTLVPIGLAAYVVGAAIYRLLMARVQRGEIFTQIFATFGLLLFMQNLANAAFTSDYHFLNNTFLSTLFGGSLRAGRLVFGVPQLAGGVIALVCFRRDPTVVDQARKNPNWVKINEIYKKYSHGQNMGDLAMREFTGFMWIADTINRAGSLEPEKLLEAAAKTFTRPKDLIIDYAGIKFDQNHQNILAGGVVAQIGWDGEKHLLWPWDKAAQSGYKVMYPSSSWDERAKHPAP